MNDCIIIVGDLPGPNRVGEGMYEGGLTFFNGEVFDGDSEDSPMDALVRATRVYSCLFHERHAAVELISRDWVGHEIKVFNLVEISSRAATDLKTKQVTVDGVLPT